MTGNNYEKLFKEVEASPRYWEEVAIGDFSREVYRLLINRNMTRTKLAKLLNTTPTRIGKILTGDVDLSLSSMAQIAFALGSKIKIQLEPIESENHAT